MSNVSANNVWLKLWLLKVGHQQDSCWSTPPHHALSTYFWTCWCGLPVEVMAIESRVASTTSNGGVWAQPGEQSTLDAESRAQNPLTCWTQWPVCPPGHGNFFQMPPALVKLLKCLNFIRLCSLIFREAKDFSRNFVSHNLDLHSLAQMTYYLFLTVNVVFLTKKLSTY